MLKPGASLYTRVSHGDQGDSLVPPYTRISHGSQLEGLRPHYTRASLTGARAKAWCFLVHAEASLPLTLPPHTPSATWLKLAPPTSTYVAAALMSSIYDEHKDDDGFLYITYSGENTFGAELDLCDELEEELIEAGGLLRTSTRPILNLLLLLLLFRGLLRRNSRPTLNLLLCRVSMPVPAFTLQVSHV